MQAVLTSDLVMVLKIKSLGILIFLVIITNLWCIFFSQPYNHQRKVAKYYYADKVIWLVVLFGRKLFALMV